MKKVNLTRKSNEPAPTTPCRGRTGNMIMPGLTVAAVIIVTLLAYAGSLTVPFQYDDEIFLGSVQTALEDNPGLFSSWSFWTNLDMRPLSALSFMVNRSLFDNNLASIHILTIAFHVTCGILLLLLLRSLLQLSPHAMLSPAWTATLSALGAGVFLLHPLPSQAVIYNSQRMEVLSALWYLAGILFYVQGRLALQRHGLSASSMLLFAGVLLSGLLSLLSKHSGAALPLTLLLFELIVFRPDKPRWVMPVVIACFIAALAFCLIWLDALLPRETDNYSRWVYLMTQSKVIALYLLKLVAPFHQAVVYDIQPVQQLNFIVTVTGLMHLVALAAALVAPARWLVPATGVALIYTSLAPTSSIIPISDLVFEHRTYLPAAGYAMILTGFSAMFTQRRRVHAIVIFVAMIGIWSYLTTQRIAVWQSPVRLWEEAVTRAPGNAEAWSNLGFLYSNDRRNEEALVCFKKAVSLDEDYADAWNNIGMIENRRGRHGPAAEAFQRALASKPDHFLALRNVGVTHFNRGDFQAAEEQFARVIALKPGEPRSYEMMAQTMIRQHRWSEAVDYFGRALDHGAGNPSLYHNMTLASMRAGEPGRAREVLAEGLKRFPDELTLVQLARRMSGPGPVMVP